MKRNRKGHGFVEAVTAAMILIPLALCLLDVTVLIFANWMNDSAVKNATRAAANQATRARAHAAARRSLTNFKPSSILRSLTLVNFAYASGQTVTCQTRIIVQLPVPFPGYSRLAFLAQASEPIVGMPRLQE